MMSVVPVTRYVTPLREGGSLPGIVEGADWGTYVCKFAGAGQGRRVLVAEVIVSGVARLLGLATPDLVVLDLDREIARYEADEEVQDLLRASVGPNLGIDFLPGAFGFEGPVADAATVGPIIVWLDAFCANVDRSWRNPNLLTWHGRWWVIDHGAALYFHHAWSGGVGSPDRFAGLPYDVSDHVLAAHVPAVADIADDLAGRLDPAAFAAVLAEVPDDWLEPVPGAASPDAQRALYVEFLTARLASRAWLPGERA